MYEVSVFARRARKILSPEQYRLLDEIKDRLRAQGLLGKNLGPSWLREIRIDNKRLYFVVKEDVVLLVDVSDKDQQQNTINGIRERLPKVGEELDALIGRE